MQIWFSQMFSTFEATKHLYKFNALLLTLFIFFSSSYNIIQKKIIHPYGNLLYSSTCFQINNGILITFWHRMLVTTNNIWSIFVFYKIKIGYNMWGPSKKWACYFILFWRWVVWQWVSFEGHSIASRVFYWSKTNVDYLKCVLKTNDYPTIHSIIVMVIHWSCG
jgi:hypothetical protein